MPDLEPRSFSKSWKGEGVAYIFGNPVTTELPVMDALLLRTRAQVTCLRSKKRPWSR